MQKTYKNVEKAYREILDVVNKHKDIVRYDLRDLDGKAKTHLFEIELREKYGLDIKPETIYNLNYTNYSNYCSIGWWGKKHNREISWSDDGKQPKDELLVVLGFSTGAYIFGEDYPEEFFQEFWQELKSYNPTYTDTTNKNLYFSISTAKDIFNNFPKILEKYREKNRVDAKKRQIEKLKTQLAELED